MANRHRDATEWRSEIAISVSHYNSWYRVHAPEFWGDARRRATSAATVLLDGTDCLRNLAPDQLEAPDDMLTFLRNSTAPPLAKERVATLAGVRKSVVDRLHSGRGLPAGYDRDEINRLIDLIQELIDPVAFPWIVEHREPTAAEREGAALIVADRSARTFFDPVLRNEQEARQVSLLTTYLSDRDYRESCDGVGVDLPPGTWCIHRNVPCRDESGRYVNLPVDCVVNPGQESPTLLIEMKSAGDFTNVNKRRKEEAAKAAAVNREFGSDAVYVLQLFGYFDEGYLNYEAAAGIDWTWDHRIDDLDEYIVR